MKRLLIAAVLALVFAAASFGAVQDFGRFTLDVPAGWTAEKDAETVGLVKDDNTASLSISVADLDGMTLKDAAEAFVKELNGTNLAQDADGDYTFEMTNANGVKSNVLLTGDDKEYCLFVMTGAETAGDEIAAIMGSLQEK